jgi:hypothetical protein
MFGLLNLVFVNIIVVIISVVNYLCINDHMFGLYALFV